MIVSEERIYHLAHVIMDAPWKDDLIDYKDEAKVLKSIREVLLDYFKKDEKVSEIVRNKISSLKNKVFEGSREWEVLYNKYYEEEFKKLI